MKTLYVTDLDGTLLNSKAMLSDFTKNTINELVNKGMQFSYATARSVNSSSYINEGLNCALPIIVYNGAFIYDISKKQNIYSLKFTKEEKKRIFNIFDKHKIYPLVYTKINGEDKISYIHGIETEGELAYLDERRGDKRLRISTPNNLNDGDVFYYTLIGPYEYLVDLYNELKEDTSFISLFQHELYRDEYWLEIMPAMATKANAILKLKEILGCDRIVSFGDALNDIPMFKISDECYAVSNAADELKKYATGIIGCNDDDAVARWLIENWTA